MENRSIRWSDVLAAEWLKIRSVRSTRHLLVALVLILVGAAALAWYAASAFDSLTPERRARFVLSPLDQVVALPVQICVAVLGILTIAAEYTTGSIRTSLTAVPRRGRVLAAKALLTAGIALVVGQLTGFGVAVVSRLVVGDRPMGFNTAPLADDVPLLLATGVTTAVVAVVGVGLGTVLRGSVGPVVIVVALLYVVPILAQALPSPVDAWVSALLPGALPGQLVGIANEGHSVYQDMLSPLGALAVLLAYPVAALVPAAVLLRRRDA
ncbi:ABC-type transport system involved in multi-copper enzyme maturation, permease component [Goodfellowiella coeruleoviolacea]|uniref:ABC-type transport system involved in multi-copper enzyme maturation, permease component n=1 Tax=Goodfellowiella coeruleoviolacea TaxID=334858 RepID=A0AAE3GL25_9PSEU|nr:ABC-type transport system involved in multi-copper enzyme maturation, permease component [Goodfellowiella coeruleoviolacea]